MALLSSNGNPLQMQCPPTSNGGPTNNHNENNANNPTNTADVYQFSSLMSNFPRWDVSSPGLITMPANQLNGGNGCIGGNGGIGGGGGSGIGGAPSTTTSSTCPTGSGILSDNFLLSHVFGAIGQQVMHHTDLDTPGSSPLTDDGMVMKGKNIFFFPLLIFCLAFFRIAAAAISMHHFAVSTVVMPSVTIASLNIKTIHSAVIIASFPLATCRQLVTHQPHRMVHRCKAINNVIFMAKCCGTCV